MKNVMVKTCLNQKIIKNSNLIQAMKNSVCPKAKVIPRPNFSESRICPNIYRMFRSVDRRHDMIIVKWHDVTLIQFFRKPNLSEYLRNVPKCGMNTRHDNREVALPHLTQTQTLRSDKSLWQMRHRFNPHKRVNDYQRYSMLTILPLRSMSCTLGNSSSLWAGGDDHFCRYYNPPSAKKDILKIFLCIWWWQMLWWKHVLTRKL